MRARQMIFMGTGLVVLAGIAIYPTIQKETRSMNHQEQIQGTWKLISADRDGKATPEDVARHIELVFEGDTLTTRNKDRATEAKFKLSSEPKPSHIDLIMDGQLGYGIYDLEGESLKIVHGEVGTARPTEFSAKPGSGLTLLVLARSRP